MLNPIEARIQWEQVEDGLRVPLVDGRWLCSRKDPASEAKRWLAKYAGDLDRFPILAVVGLGAGLHIIELAMAYPDKEIFVFEKERALIEAFRFSIERHKNICVVAFSSVTETLNQPYFELFCHSGAPILAFMPGVHHWREEAGELHRALLGQTSPALGLRLSHCGAFQVSDQVDKLIGTEPLQLGSVVEDLSRTENECSAYWGILKELIR